MIILKIEKNLRQPRIERRHPQDGHAEYLRIYRIGNVGPDIDFSILTIKIK